MNVLVACEFSGIVRDAFIGAGHNAVSVDLLPTDSDSGPHLSGDVKPLLGAGWDLVVAHPPCTYLCNSGVRWLHTRPERWELMRQAAQFFLDCLGANAPRVCVENPIPHRYAMEIIGRKYSQIIQPWMFGHGQSKATCLWLKGLPNLEPTEIVSGREGRVWRMAPSPNRSSLRSITYSGIALAMADQWGALNGGNLSNNTQQSQPATEDSNG